MCPDRQLISLYLDGELPSPWKEKLESHLGECASCAGALESVRGGAAALSDLPAAGLEDARARVWRKVAVRADARPRPSAWNRRIAMPIPAAIAAMLIVALAAAGGMGMARAPSDRDAVAIVPTAQNVAIPVSDIGSVLRYLEAQDSSADIVIIRLPEAANFSSAGEPTLIRAADYRGRPTN